MRSRLSQFRAITGGITFTEVTLPAGRRTLQRTDFTSLSATARDTDLQTHETTSVCSTDAPEFTQCIDTLTDTCTYGYARLSHTYAA